MPRSLIRTRSGKLISRAFKELASVVATRAIFRAARRVFSLKESSTSRMLPPGAIRPTRASSNRVFGSAVSSSSITSISPLAARS